MDASQGISCWLGLVFRISGEVISNDIGLLLLDVNNIVVNIQLHRLGVNQDRIDFHPMPHLKNELLRVSSKGNRLSVPVNQLYPWRFQVKDHFSAVGKRGVDLSNARIGRTRKLQVPIRDYIGRIAEFIDISSSLMDNVGLLLEPNCNKLITSLLTG